MPPACRTCRCCSPGTPRLDTGGPVEHQQLVEVPLTVPSAEAPLSPVMTITSVSFRTPRSSSGVEQPTDVMVGVCQEARVDLHLAREDELEHVRDLVVDARDAARRRFSQRNAGLAVRAAEELRPLLLALRPTRSNAASPKRAGAEGWNESSAMERRSGSTAVTTRMRSRRSCRSSSSMFPLPACSCSGS